MSGEAQFKIVQTNQFKASDHLRLNFKKGNDEAIKKYLARKYKEFKESYQQLTDKYNNDTSNMSQSNQKMEQVYQKS